MVSTLTATSLTIGRKKEKYLQGTTSSLKRRTRWVVGSGQTGRRRPGPPWSGSETISLFSPQISTEGQRWVKLGNMEQNIHILLVNIRLPTFPGMLQSRYQTWEERAKPEQWTTLCSISWQRSMQTTTQTSSDKM